jgi:hypothetical protein
MTMKISDLPSGKSPQPIVIPHFPDVIHAVVWRNWDVVPAGLIAKILRATEAQIGEIARSMGLPDQRHIATVEIQRNSSSIVRRNWHLLPYEQLCELLGWDAKTMDFRLNEDDGLWSKLGGYKPKCPPVHYAAPTPAARARAAEIARILKEELGDQINAPAEEPFGFTQRFDQKMQRPEGPSDAFSFRMVFPYLMRYGDPLIGDDVDGISQGYLEQLAASGINAIWLVGVLYTLYPWDLAPDLSVGWEKRLENLNRLVERCGILGIEVLLYFNEPRAMPPAFFDKHPELRGVNETPGRAPVLPNVVALCTSTKPVQDFIVNGVRHVFEKVPKLGGAFTIFYSESLTNCYSRKYTKDGVDEEFLLRTDGTGTDPNKPVVKACPRCLERGPEVVCAEVCTLIEKGMREAGSKGKFILYVWSTPPEWMPGIIQRLPQSTWVQCVSEWGKTFTRGDYTGKVNEYSISIIGPSELSLGQWKLSQARGLKTIAKMQAANTYELNTVPYIPALRRVAEHLENVANAKVDGITLGWTAGGSPSPNLELVGEFCRSPRPTVPEAMRNVAVRRFGEAAADGVVEAWNLLSDAYGEFPFDIDVCYNGPQCLGPSNLLYAKPSGFVATQVGFAFDDLDGWRGPYSAQTLQSQFQKLSDLWEKGVEALDRLRKSHPSEAMEDEWRVAEACRIHFRSAANQIQFVRTRQSDVTTARKILHDELDLARRAYALVLKDSRIGFETTDQYEYLRFDLAEKILNCRQVLSEMK